MGNLHFIGGEKGGVGKSFTARLLAQYMVDHNLPFVGFDTDRSHATFSRFYGQFVSAIDPDKLETLDRVVEFAEANPGHHVLVDLAAQTSAKLKRWAQETNLYDLMHELGYETFHWHVMDESADSLLLLERELRALQDERLHWVLVENQGRGADFTNFETSDLCRRARQAGARIMPLAALNPPLAQKIDFNNYSFWAAAHSQECMTFAERQRMKVWLDNAYRQIEALLQPAAVALNEVVYTS